MFTREGYRIHGAVVYNNPAKTADAIAALKPAPTPDVIVNSLADEIENHRFDKGWLEIVAHLEGRIPELSSHPRVNEERAKNAARIEAERQTAERLRTEENARIDGMTAVASGDCTPLETAAAPDTDRERRRNRRRRHRQVGEHGSPRKAADSERQSE